MEKSEFKKGVSTGVLLCLFGGIIFWIAEYLTNIVTGSTLRLTDVFSALFIYSVISLIFGLLLAFILLILYRIKNKWIAHINIIGFFAAIFISTVNLLYIGFDINQRHLTDSPFPAKIFANIGITALGVICFIVVYFWLKYAYGKGKFWPLYIALAFSLNIFVILGWYLNYIFKCNIYIKNFILVNSASLAGTAVLISSIFISLQFIFSLRKGNKISLLKKITFLASLIFLIVVFVVAFYMRINYFKPAFISPKDISSNQRNLPNIILITIDTLRADHLSCYGYRKIKTPNIDKLAADGILFEKAISQSPWTSPSVASILTSLYPTTHKCGGFHWNKGKRELKRISRPIMTLAEFLRDKGFLTHALVTNPYLNKIHGFSDGFNTYINLDLSGNEVGLFCFKLTKKDDKYTYTPGDIVTDKAIEWLEDNSNKQFFLWLHYMDSHFPYAPPAKYRTNLNYKGKLLHKNLSKKLHLIYHGNFNLSSEDKEYLESLYNGEIKFVDEQMGRLMQRLKDLGLLNKSIIVVTSDHGEEFWEHGSWEHGHTVYNELLHVPLIFRFPNAKVSRGKRIQKLVRLIDIFPTILEFLDIDYEGPIQGKSLIPLILDQEVEKTICFIEYLLYYEERKSIIDDYYKYIYNTDSGKETLYNLQVDPGELQDLSKEMPDVTLKMQNQLKDIIKNAEKLQKMLSKGEEDKPPEIDKALREKLKALGYVH